MESILYPIVQHGNLFHYHHKQNTVKNNNEHRFHYHTFYEIYLLINSSCDFFIEDAKYRLNQHDVIIIPPYKFHKPLPNIGSVHDRIVLNIFPDFYQELHCENYEKLLAFIAEKRPKIHGFEVRRYNVLNIFNDIDKYFKNDYSHIDPMVNFKIVELLYMLYYITKTSKFNNKNMVFKDKTGLVQDLLRFINDNFQKICNVDMVIENFYYSKSYLDMLFKKEMGVTLAKYISMKKLENVNKLYSYGLTLSNAATESGFTSYRHFAYVYKQEFGVSPKNGLKHLR